MKKTLPILLGLLLSGVISPIRSARAQELISTRSAIVLNGITTILGDKLALFKVTLADGTPPISFMLAEGQSRYGLQLVAVDVRSGAVTIHTASLTRVISICNTPELPVVRPATAAFARSFSGSAGVQDQAGRMNDPADASSGNGSPADPGFYAGIAAGAGKSQGDDADPSSAADSSSASDSPSPTNSHVYQWWVKEAQKIENARQETAQRVLAGEWEPYPQTPLTPAGTPAALIGQKSLFADHGPGMIIASQ